MNARKLNPFKVLAETANEEKTNEAFDDLFKTFFGLENLYFVSPKREDWQNAGPFIGMINEQPCIFAFTDLAIAFDFCMSTPGFQWENESAFIMHLPMNECVIMFRQLAKNGVFGIRINEKTTGFFLPMSHLDGIIENVMPSLLTK